MALILVAVLGVALITIGVALIYPALGFIVLGVALVLAAYYIAEEAG